MSILNKLTEIFNINSKDELNHVTTAFDNALSDTDTDINKLDLEYDLNTASGLWLDEYGSWFGVYRKYQQSDDDYRKDIIKKFRKQHSTANAYTRLIKDIMGEDTTVVVYETYKDVRIFNQSTFSGHGRYQNKDKYRMNVVELLIDKPITGEVVSAIEKIRASGIKVYFQYVGLEIVNMGEPTVYSLTTSSKESEVTPVKEHSLSGSQRTILSGSKEVLSEYDM